MGIKKYKPTSPGIRFMTRLDYSILTKKEPEKRLLLPLKKTGGRNVYGRITSRFRGGGHKRFYRIVDFKRDKFDIPGKVVALEYDPNRTVNLALVVYKDGEKRYIIAPEGLKVGDTVISSLNGGDIKVGNAFPLMKIPDGTLVHNVELYPGKGGQIARSAGTYAQIMAKEGSMVLLKLPSGEMRYFHGNCMATVGQAGNLEHENVTIGKAGRTRWLGRRPHNRGVSMNPCDHPHGGGEGKAGQGNPHPVSPWGLLTKGYKTRRKRKPSDKFILKRRK